jgi:signal transduction histidine kinase
VRLASFLRDRPGELANWAFVAVLAASAQIEIWTEGDPSAQRLAAALILLGATVPLAWRTTAPFPVAVVVAVSIFLGSVGFESYGASFQAWVALLIALYSLAAHADRRGRLLGASAVAVAIGGFQLVELLRGEEVEGVPGIWLSLVVAFLLGRLRRWQLRESVHLRSRATQLEREREEKARLAVAEERARIARELHDVVAHHLSVAIIQIVAAHGDLTADGRSNGPVRHLGSAEQSCRQALDEMRRLLDVLRPDEAGRELAPTPGLGELDGLVAGVRSAGLPVEVVIEGPPTTLGAGLDLAAYRVAQEALTNALKYARGARTLLTLRYGPEAIEVEVVDDGQTSHAVGDGSGRGLVGMRERVALYNGRLEAGPRDEGGFRVWARLPISPDAA